MKAVNDSMAMFCQHQPEHRWQQRAHSNIGEVEDTGEADHFGQADCSHQFAQGGVAIAMHPPRTHYQQLWQFRIALLVSIGLVVPLGYWVRFAPADKWGWLSDALGSVAYEVFWILLILLCWPRGSIAQVAVAVCLATCAIEFLQLWQPPFLQALRATLPGRLILGNTFSWADFLAYALGSWVGYGWAKTLQRQ